MMRKFLWHKGQDIIEYALMLAIIVGIGWLIYAQGSFAGQINGVFNHAGNLIDRAGSASEQDTNMIHDRNYADAMGDLLKDAISNGSIQLDPGKGVFLAIQNAPNGEWYINGGQYNGGNRGYGGFRALWEQVDRNGSYKDTATASVAQSGIDWYAVKITNNGDGNGYTLSYIEGKGYTNSSKTGFDPEKGTVYKTEQYNP